MVYTPRVNNNVTIHLIQAKKKLKKLKIKRCYFVCTLMARHSRPNIRKNARGSVISVVSLATTSGFASLVFCFLIIWP